MTCTGETSIETISMYYSWLSKFINKDWRKDANFMKLYIIFGKMSSINLRSICIMNIVVETFSSNNINNNSSSLLNSYSSFSITIIILSINLSLDSWKKSFKFFDHNIKIIKIIISKFFLFTINS